MNRRVVLFLLEFASPKANKIEASFVAIAPVAKLRSPVKLIRLQIQAPTGTMTGNF